MKIHDLKPPKGSTKQRRRVGRGIAGKGGKTAGRSNGAPQGLVDHSHAGARHSIVTQAGNHEKGAPSLASAKTRDRITPDSILDELALNLLQSRKRVERLHPGQRGDRR